MPVEYISLLKSAISYQNNAKVTALRIYYVERHQDCYVLG
jgi:hypothetical protein